MRVMFAIVVVLALASMADAGPFSRSCAGGQCQKPAAAKSAPQAAAPQRVRLVERRVLVQRSVVRRSCR